MDQECLTEFCNTAEHKCISQEKAEKGKIFGGDGDSDTPREGEGGINAEKRNLEIKNVVLVASIIAFVCLAAFFIKCVQRQSNNGTALQRATGYEQIPSEITDENMTSA